MKLKNSVKLSALSLSLVALAVTSCGGSKNNDAKKDEKVTTDNNGGKTTDPVVDPKGGEEKPKSFDAKTVTKLHVSGTLSIPQFGCAPLNIEVEKEGGAKDVHTVTSSEFLVEFIGESNSKFEFLNNQVCTVKENTNGKTVAGVGDKGEVRISLKYKPGVRAVVPLEVADKEVIKAVIAVPASFTPPTSDIPTLETALVNAKQDLRVAEGWMNKDGYAPTNYNLLDVDHNDQKSALIEAELKSNKTVQAVLYDDFLKTVKLLDTEFKKIQSADLAAMGNLSSVGNLKADTLANLFKRRDVSKHLSALTDTFVQAGITQAEKDARQTVQNVLRQVNDLYNTLKSIDSRLIQNSFAITDYTASTDSTPGSDLITITDLDTKFDAILTADLKTKLNAKPKLQAVKTALQAVKTAETALNTAKSTQGTAKLVTVAAGSNATIHVSKLIYGKNDKHALSANDVVEITNDTGKKLAVKVIPAAANAKQNVVEFTAPKDETNGPVNYQVTVNGASTTLRVDVGPAVINKVSLKGEHVQEINGIHYVKFASHGAFDVFAKYTDDSEKQITSVIHTSPINLIVPSSNYQSAKPAAEKVHFTSLSETSNYIPASIPVTVGSGSAQAVKLYVVNKPLFTNAKVEADEFQANGSRNGSVKVTSTPVGSYNYSDMCLSLTGLDFAMVGIDAASIPAGTSLSKINQPFTGFSFKEPAKDSGFVIVPATAGVSEKLCATKTAAPGASIEVGIMYENSVVATSKVSVAQPVLTNTITLSSTRNANGLFTEPVIIVTDASKEIPIDLYRLKSDGSVSTTDKATVGTMYNLTAVDTGMLTVDIQGKVKINSTYLSTKLKPGQTAKMQLKVVPVNSSYKLTTETEKPSDIITIQYTK
jgi:hypothetical protein